MATLVQIGSNANLRGAKKGAEAELGVCNPTLGPNLRCSTNCNRKSTLNNTKMKNTIQSSNNLTIN